MHNDIPKSFQRVLKIVTLAVFSYLKKSSLSFRTSFDTDERSRSKENLGEL